MLTRWNTRNSLVKLGYERAVSCRFPAGSVLPAASGSSLVRQYKKKTHDAVNEDLGKDQGIAEAAQAAQDQGDALPWEMTGAEMLENFGRPMSTRTARKVREKITAMYEAGIAKAFVTLGFVNDCPDSLAVKILAKMLREWRKEWGKFNFLWVVERQENGRPHFHLVLDRTVRKEDIKRYNARWVRMQYNSGIVYTAKAGPKKKYQGPDLVLDPTNLSPAVIASYVNPFDIEYIYSSSGLKSYLAGYVTKSIGEKFKCQTWHCSRGVSELFTEIMTSADVHRKLLESYPGCPNVYVYKKDVVNPKTGQVKRKAGDIVFPVDNTNEHCSWVYIVNVEQTKVFTSLITDLNKEVLAGDFIFDKKIIFYDYEQYARAFLHPNDYGYKLYKKVVHDWSAKDASNYYHIEQREIDMETDFYQYSKAMRGRGYFSVYSEQPYITDKGQRFYNGKYFNQYEFLKEINNHKKMYHAYN